jgi:hypothetical protein
MTEEAESVVDDESEFESAFDEIAAQRDAGPADEEGAAGEEATKEPTTEETEETPAAASSEEAAEEAPDPYAGMTDEVKAKFMALESDRDALKHTIDSDAGRVRAFQLKVNGLEEEISKIRESGTAGPSQSQIADAMKGSDEDWESFSESYPDVAKAIDKRSAALIAKVDEAVEATLAPVKQESEHLKAEQAKAANEEKVEAVAELYPTWTEAVKTTEFQTWLDEQPQGVSSLSESDDVRDASTLIGLYDAHLVANGHPSLKADPTESGVTETPANTGPTDLASRRAQQLQDGESVPSQKAGIQADGPVEDEFEAAFNVFAKRKAAANRA